MSCNRARALLDAWLDDELDPATRAEIAAHLAQCPSCAPLRAERERLREAIRAAAPREAVPSAFAGALRRTLEREDAALDRRRRGPSWWQAAGFAAAAGAIAAAVTLIAVRVPSMDAPRDQLLASHVAALALAQGRHERLVQVATPDRHVVKPWFQGKVDFSPPVRDLSAEGFELLGGRLDRVGERSAAVVVYRIRNHPIDLFVWRAAADGPVALQVSTQRGFGIAQWAGEGLRYAAVSDVDPRDLERFARSLQPLP